MNVKINETGEVKQLSIVDRESGVNWVSDLIGNAGALNDGQFVWSEEDDAYLVSQDNYDWWVQYIADAEATEAEVEALADELGLNAKDVWFRIQENSSHDYNDHRSDAVRTMQEIRDEHAS